jgi:hypothetical protein
MPLTTDKSSWNYETNESTNTLITEPEISTTAISRPATENDPEPVPSTSRPHNILS